MLRNGINGNFFISNYISKEMELTEMLSLVSRHLNLCVMPKICLRYAWKMLKRCPRYCLMNIWYILYKKLTFLPFILLFCLSISGMNIISEFQCTPTFNPLWTYIIYLIEGVLNSQNLSTLNKDVSRKF